MPSTLDVLAGVLFGGRSDELLGDKVEYLSSRQVPPDPATNDFVPL